MSQTYTLLLAAGTLQTDRTTINNMLEALRSSFSGSADPSSPAPVAGQLFFDTDDNKLYCYDNTGTPVKRQIATVSSSVGLQQSQSDIANNTTAYPYIAATGTVRVMSTLHAITITAISLVSDAAVATDAANYYTFAVQNGGTGGAGTTAICSQTTNSAGGAAITANTSYSLGTISNANIAANEQIKIVITKTLVPTALATARVYIVIQYRTN